MSTHADTLRRKSSQTGRLEIDDPLAAAMHAMGKCRIAADAGAPDLALDSIRQLLAMPAGTFMSATRLKLDPIRDPLRKALRFQAQLSDDGGKP
jgi:hypothetical protein